MALSSLFGHSFMPRSQFSLALTELRAVLLRCACLCVVYSLSSGSLRQMLHCVIRYLLCVLFSLGRLPEAKGYTTTTVLCIVCKAIIDTASVLIAGSAPKAFYTYILIN